MSRKKIEAVAYLRTSSATNASIGIDKDSDKRQRVAITSFAKLGEKRLVIVWPVKVDKLIAEICQNRECGRRTIDKLARTARSRNRLTGRESVK